MSKKAMWWAFNLLAAFGIIATLFLGFYLLVGGTQTKDVQTVKADISQLKTSNQLLTLLRVQAGETTIADRLAAGSTAELEAALKTAYGQQVKYKIVLDGLVKRDNGLSTVTAELNATIPAYAGNTKSLFVEVGS